VKPSWAIAVASPDLGERGRSLAERTGRPLVDSDSREHPFLVTLTAGRLELRRTGPGAPGPLHVDFAGGIVRQRLRTTGRRSLLGKALGFSRKPPEQVVDATAGLGEERPDAIHLDPMYPARSKSALSGKAMQLAQQLVGKDEDAGELLQAALARARRRVVVKRPMRSAPLAETSPDFEITGKKTRYDIYLPHE